MARTGDEESVTGGLRVTSPAPRDAWKEVLAGDPEALVFHTPAWIDTMCAAGSWEDASRLYEFSGDRRLVMPIARRTRIPETFAWQGSLPGSWGMGGLVGAGGATPDEVRQVFVDLGRQPVLRTAIRPNPLQAAAWAAASPPGVLALPRIAHVLDLDGGFDHVWKKRFTGSARTAVRKAEGSNLVVESDTSGRLASIFYQLFELSLDRWAAHQHEPRALARWRGHRRDPRRKLEAIARLKTDACRIWIAWLEGRPAAGILVLRDVNASYTRGAMDVDLAGPTRANYLLHKLAIEEACAAGCRRYHMGETGTSASLAQFKTRFGAEAVPYAEYRIERFPLTSADRWLRGLVKKAIGFRD